MKLDQAEKDYLAATNENLSTAGLLEAYAKGVEGVYPDIKGWADKTLSSPTVKSLLGKWENGRLDDINAAEEEALEAAAEKLES